MGKHAQWVTHKGVKMLFVNCHGLPEAECVAALEEMKEEILKQRSFPPTLIDLTESTMTSKTRNKAKEVAAAGKTADIPDGPCAVVGLTSVAKTVAQLLQRGKVHYSNTIDEAKEWLVKEVGKR
jgi:hypothetical protein